MASRWFPNKREKEKEKMAANAGAAFGVKLSSKKAYQNVRSEFREFSLSELKEFEQLFEKYDMDKDGALSFEELKYMMEKLGMPQTHLGLKAMIQEVDEDHDNMMSYREFVLIFRYAKTGKLVHSGLKALADSIDVGKEGVGGAKQFFEAKAAETVSSTEEKDRAYREEVKRKNQEKAQARAAFKDRIAHFQ